ncbi:hypothetical protein FCULG_00007310 [Fusarium culmorum]|uniref:Uncharacterized protein n=1 Tax=Fusarium culmorum TaxID=5516 RepID=A0A2T4H408_FUSCU|nr:hypothetical protein FCULG_00007310 [Fusarium culmorum]
MQEQIMHLAYSYWETESFVRLPSKGDIGSLARLSLFVSDTIIDPPHCYPSNAVVPLQFFHLSISIGDAGKHGFYNLAQSPIPNMAQRLRNRPS